jgi:hypothetical protein
MKASKDGYDRAFLVAVVGDRLSEYRPSDGWRLTKLNDDPVWDTATFDDTANVVVGGRYVVYLEPTSENFVKTQHQLTVFDTQKSTFTALLPAPNDVFYFANTPEIVNEHTIQILVGRQVTMEENRITGVSFFSRTIDVVTGMYNDVPFDESLTAEDIEGPSQYGEYFIRLSAEEVVTVANGFAHLNRRPADAKTPRIIGFVDDVAQEKGSNPKEHVFYDVVKRESFATVPSWRQVSMKGWSGRIGYFDAASTDDTIDPKADRKFGPAVFDASAQSWDFVFADQPLILDDREFSITMFVVGVMKSAG